MLGSEQKKELGIGTSKLIIIILLNVVIFWSLFVLKNFRKIGLHTLKLTITIWCLICFAAYLLMQKIHLIDINFMEER
jgi:UMF1 family MFS transporter